MCSSTLPDCQLLLVDFCCGGTKTLSVQSGSRSRSRSPQSCVQSRRRRVIEVKLPVSPCALEMNSCEWMLQQLMQSRQADLNLMYGLNVCMVFQSNVQIKCLVAVHGGIIGTFWGVSRKFKNLCGSKLFHLVCRFLCPVSSFMLLSNWENLFIIPGVREHEHASSIWLISDKPIRKVIYLSQRNCGYYLSCFGPLGCLAAGQRIQIQEYRKDEFMMEEKKIQSVRARADLSERWRIRRGS